MVTFSGVELWFGVARETRPQRPVYVTKEIVYLLYFLKREFSEVSLGLRGSGLFVRVCERTCLGPVDGGDDIDLILILMYAYFICLMF